MGKVIYCNSFDVTFMREAFILVFRFKAPDGYGESAHIVITPEGASVLHEFLEGRLKEYIETYGNIPVGSWRRLNEQKEEDNCTYLT